MWLHNHNPLKQTYPNAMHTIKDVIEKMFALIIGRQDSVKVRNTEKKLGRFPPSQSGTVPYVLSRGQVKLCPGSDPHRFLP